LSFALLYALASQIHLALTLPSYSTSMSTYLGEESHGHKGEKPPYDFHIGDSVVYHPVGASPNITVGIIRDILQEPEIVGEGRPVNVRASEEEPRFVSRNNIVN
jgi:hypothetical protein